MQNLTSQKLIPSNRSGWPWAKPHSTPADTALPADFTWPRVSIVTPSFNQGQYIEATIRSVLLQGYPNLEYIVIDGGSTDNSVEIIRRYEPWLTCWVSEKDRGQAHAINKGLAKATGQIFGWLNSDDIFFPNAIHQMVKLYTQYPSNVAWVGGCQRINPLGRVLSTVLPKNLDRDGLANWFYQGFFYQPSCFFSSQAWEQVGGLDESFHYAMDLDLWLKLAAIGEFVSTPHIISAATIHNDAKTQSRQREMHAETALVQLKHGYQQAALHRLKRLLEPPSLKNKLWKLLKVDFKHSLLNISFKKEQQNLYYLRLPVDGV